MPGHLTRFKTPHLSSSQTPRLADAPGSCSCYTLRVGWRNRQSRAAGLRKEMEMDVTIAVLILAAGIIVEHVILSRARERAKREDVVIARLARYAGRQTR